MYSYGEWQVSDNLPVDAENLVYFWVDHKSGRKENFY